MMTEEKLHEYRDGRYAEALKYYDDRAMRNRRWYHFSYVYVLTVSVALTPILLGDFPKGYGSILAALLAPTLALVAGISDHFRFHEAWLRSRSTWDLLRHELHYYDAEAGPYKGVEDRNAAFVERVETLMSREGRAWQAHHAAKDTAIAPKV